MLPKLICYHPVRYDFYLKELLNFVIDEYNSADPEEKGKYQGFLFGMYFEKEVEEMLGYEPRAIPAHLYKEQWIEYKSELFYANANIYDEGENIFHLQEDLLKMFQHTDVSEIQIEQLLSPYPSFYLYFGDSKEFKLDNGKYIDGAYVEHDSNQETISLHLTSRDESLDTLLTKASELDYLLTEDHLYYLLSGDWGKKKTVGDNIKEEIANKGYESGESARFNLWEPHIKNICNVIINTLCFLTSEHNDVNYRFPEITPKAFIDKYARAETEKRKETALSKAKAQGYRRVKFLGDTYKRKNTDSAKKTESVSSHWRRGHWRNQAYGPSRGQHKLLWIKPTLVNKNKDSPLVKHVYDV